MKYETVFSGRIYKIVKRIPKGKVLTYKEVAKRAGSSRACRAVGNVLNRDINPKIPCHRVIRSDGRVGGYRKGVKNKILILKKEGIKINPFGKLRVNPEHHRRIKNGKITPGFN